MRARGMGQEQVAEVARRRLEQLSIELAGLRRDQQPAAELDDGLDDLLLPEPGRSVDTGLTTPPRDAPVIGRHARRSVGPGGLIEGWLHDRLPPTLQGRVQLGAAHLAVVAVMVAAALGVTAWWVLRAHGSGTVVSTMAPRPGSGLSAGGGSPSPLLSFAATAPAALAGSPAAPAASSSPAAVVVDVTGKVRRPGIATLPAGSRIADALKAAGGARRRVDLSTLNLAEVLVDGEQIVVGVRAPPGVAASAASVPGASSSAVPLVNINTADETMLDTLPGVGPVTATAILKWRADNGAFSSVDELLDVSGIGDATLAEIAPFVTL